MSQILHISEDAYRLLEALAQREGQTPAEIVESWVVEHAPRDPQKQPRYYTTDEWFRHLDMSEQDIAEAKESATADNGEYDADA